VADEYASGEYRYWHLSVPSPELTQAIEDGWFPTRGRVLDLGCGAGTEGRLPCWARRHVRGIDLSVHALTIAFG
jgi:predicted TPR repeat methyltransferase